LEKISLETIVREDFPGQIGVIDARARANVVAWGFILLIVTIVLGLAAYVWLHIDHLETNTLREFLQTTVAGEIGLLAGLFGSKNSLARSGQP